MALHGIELQNENCSTIDHPPNRGCYTNRLSSCAIDPFTRHCVAMTTRILRHAYVVMGEFVGQNMAAALCYGLYNLI